MINNCLPFLILICLLFEGPISYSLYIFAIFIFVSKVLNNGISLKLKLYTPVGAFTIFGILSLISLAMQLLYGNIDVWSYLPQFYGLTKIPLYLFAIQLLNDKNKKRLINILAIYIIFAGFISILFVVGVDEIEKIHSFFGMEVSRTYARSFGFSSTVHDGASIFAYYFVFIDIFKKNINKKLGLISYVSSIIGVILSFSLAYILALFLIEFYKKLNLKNILALFYNLSIPRKFIKRLNLRNFIILIFISSSIFLLNIYNRILIIFEKMGQVINLLFIFISDNSIRDITLNVSLIGRITNGWTNALNVWRDYPFFGNNSIVLNSSLYYGDGGYTEILSQRGLLGLGAFFLLLFFLGFNLKGVIHKDNNYYQFTKQLVFLFLIPMIAVNFIQDNSSIFVSALLIYSYSFRFDEGKKNILDYRSS